MAKSNKESAAGLVQKSLELYPFWEAFEDVILPAARKYLRRAFAADDQRRLRRRTERKLLDLRNGRPSHPALSYYGFLLVCYYRLRALKSAEGGGLPLLHTPAVEWRACRLVTETFKIKSQV